MKKILISFLLSVFVLGGEKVMANEGLNEQDRLLVQISATAALGNQNVLKQFLTQALEADINIEVLKEILVQSYAYCGFPRSLNALQTLQQVAQEKNIKNPSKDLNSQTILSDSLLVGTQNQTNLVGTEVKGSLFDFAPQIDQYLKAHLFGDIFSRNIISWRTRELATIAMLAVRNGVESQLQAHINIGKHNGLKDSEITEVLSLARQQAAKNVLFGFGAPNTTYAKYFIGNSYLQPLNDKGVQIANVTFEPKCRNNWHIHHKGAQILMVVSGRGWYQEWGKEASEIKAGDVVYIAPSIKHWHGAAKDSWMTHIAIAEPAENASTEWLEEVSDEQYNLLP